MMSGFTENYIRVEDHVDDMRGKISEHTLKEINENGNFIVTS